MADKGLPEQCDRVWSKALDTLQGVAKIEGNARLGLLEALLLNPNASDAALLLRIRRELARHKKETEGEKPDAHEKDFWIRVAENTIKRLLASGLSLSTDEVSAINQHRVEIIKELAVALQECKPLLPALQGILVEKYQSILKMKRKHTRDVSIVKIVKTRERLRRKYAPTGGANH